MLGHNAMDSRKQAKTVHDVICDFLFVGFISFGGTAANQALFRSILIDKGYLTQEEFAETFALAQCLPGPSASQVLLNGVISGTKKVWLGFFAFFAFMTPAAIFLAMFGTMVSDNASPSMNGDVLSSPVVVTVQEFIGLAAISIICIASYDLTCKLVRDDVTRAVFGMTCICMVGFSNIWWVTPLCLIMGGTSTLVHTNCSQLQQEHHDEVQDVKVLNKVNKKEALNCDEMKSIVNDEKIMLDQQQEEEEIGITPFLGIILLIAPWLLFILFLFLQYFILEETDPIYEDLHIINIFLRIGIFVYGGGPVVVPLLITQLVPEHLLTQNQFLIGFSVVSMLPGPMFNLAAYCGAIIGGPVYALICWAAMSLPGISMSIGALPLWSEIRQIQTVKHVLNGVNAAAAGLMTAAFIDLWLKLVGTQDDDNIILNVNARAAVVIAFVSIQVVFKFKSAAVILSSILAGLMAAYYLNFL